MNKENQSFQPEGVLYAVYGTLRKGFGNYQRLLNNEFSKYLGTQRTAPIYTMRSLGGFPGVFLDGKDAVTIEVFDVTSKDVEQRLDWLEGYPSFYDKTTVETEWGPANMYYLRTGGYEKNDVVASGDWKEFLEERKKAYVNA